MKYKKRNLYTDANGKNIILRFEDNDDELRLDLHAVLNFIYDKCDSIDFNYVMSRPKKWGYSRLTEQETMNLLNNK
tara:strand:+ start:344 stop:571 length:228 start_codon:yes stop_codon:yes gene_type:complete